MNEAPPLGLSFPNILFQFFNFLIFLWLMYRLLYRPVTRMLQARRDKIAESLQESDNLRAQVERERAAYQTELAGARAEALRIREEAGRTAETIRSRELERAREDAERLRAEAQADIARSRARAAQELRDQTADLVLAATAKVLDRAIDDPEHRRLVQSALAELGAQRS
ncbi:MAG: F0F1 ATP synthase subunit B [Actinobacteria bacterium]|nr:F0F1 ATP synthase subunit B [Actinomycetota bacterium]